MAICPTVPKIIRTRLTWEESAKFLGLKSRVTLHHFVYRAVRCKCLKRYRGKFPFDVKDLKDFAARWQKDEPLPVAKGKARNG